MRLLKFLAVFFLMFLLVGCDFFKSETTTELSTTQTTTTETTSLQSITTTTWPDITTTILPTTEVITEEDVYYTVTFYNGDGTVLDEQTVEEGTNAQRPIITPWKNDVEYTYTFNHWDVNYTNVTSDLQIYPVFDSVINEYTVTFYTHEDLNIDLDIYLNPDETITDLYLGEDRSFVVTSENRVFTYGMNRDSIIGVTLEDDDKKPIEITGFIGFLSNTEKVIKIISKAENTFILTDIGNLYISGQNYYGTVTDYPNSGERRLFNFANPNFTLATGERIIDIYATDNSGFALTSNNRLLSWGRNIFGELGNGTFDNTSIPQDITSSFGLHTGEEIRQVATGSCHAGILTTENRVFLWGNNMSGQLVNGSFVNSNVPTEYVAPAGYEGSAINSVALGGNNTAILYGDGSTHRGGYIYGANTLVQVDYLDLLDEGEFVEEINCSFGNIMYLTNTYRVLIEGKNNYGQLGIGTISSSVSGLIDITDEFDLETDETIVELYMENYQNGVSTSNGRYLLWGFNEKYQLFSNDYYTLYPEKINNNLGLEVGEYVEQIYYGDYEFATIVLTSNHRVLYWNYGQGIMVPSDITDSLALSVDEVVEKVQCGKMGALVLTSQNRLLAWGANGYGELGNGDIFRSDTPLDITSFLNLNPGELIQDVSYTENHVILFTSEHRVLSWGRNDHGQLGNDTLIESRSPLDITSQFSFHVNEEVIAVYTGIFNSALVTTENRLFIWGASIDDTFDITKAAITTPLEVSATTEYNILATETIKDVYLGIGRLMIFTDQRIIFKGGSAYNLDTAISESEFSLEDIYMIHSNQWYTIVVTDDFRIYTIGLGLYLGNGTLDNSESFVEITDNFDLAALETITAVDTTISTVSVTTNLGNVYVWGATLKGQLGAGIPSIIVSPTEQVFFETYALDSETVMNYQLLDYVPVRVGYTFDGWYYDELLTEKVTDGTYITGDIAFYGKWIKEDIANPVI